MRGRHKLRLLGPHLVGPLVRLHARQGRSGVAVVLAIAQRVESRGEVGHERTGAASFDGT